LINSFDFALTACSSIVVNVATYLGADNPSNSPAWESEALRKAIDDQNVIFVNILNVVCGADSGTVAIAGIVVAPIEFIHDKSRPISADILNLGELGVLDHPAGRVTRVRSQDDRCATSNLLGDFVRVNMVAVGLCEGTRNSCKLFKVNFMIS
jgi:hypothetical protein